MKRSGTALLLVLIGTLLGCGTTAPRRPAQVEVLPIGKDDAVIREQFNRADQSVQLVLILSPT